jgi:hypothetical protein
MKIGNYFFESKHSCQNFEIKIQEKVRKSKNQKQKSREKIVNIV